MTLRQDLRRGGQMHRSSHGSKPSDGELRQCPASCVSILKMYRLRGPIAIWDRDSGRLESDVRAGDADAYRTGGEPTSLLRKTGAG